MRKLEELPFTPVWPLGGCIPYNAVKVVTATGFIDIITQTH